MSELMNKIIHAASNVYSFDTSVDNLEITFEDALQNNAFETTDGEVSLTSVSNFWCPYCGGWHGAGQPPRTPGNEPAPAPRIPEVLGRIVGRIVEAETNVHKKPIAPRWPETGTINNEPAQIWQAGDRIRVIWDGTVSPDPYNHNEIITNDGLNANYVREMDEHVIVDDSKNKPYQPYTRDTSNRIVFD